MTALGPGTRVWVGWCPPERIRGQDGRLRTGTILDGPFPPGSVIGGRVAYGVCWAVGIDGIGPALVRETILSPLDDGDPEAVEQVDELEVLA